VVWGSGPNLVIGVEIRDGLGIREPVVEAIEICYFFSVREVDIESETPVHPDFNAISARDASG
jgi:hypothetical protein